MKRCLIFILLILWSAATFADNVQNLYDRNRRSAKCRKDACRAKRQPTNAPYYYYYPEPQPQPYYQGPLQMENYEEDEFEDLDDDDDWPFDDEDF